MAGEIQLNGTSFVSESSGTVTINNATIGSNIAGIGQLVGFSFANASNTAGNIVTVESGKDYDALLMVYSSGSNYIPSDFAYANVDSSGNVTVGKYSTFISSIALESPGTNQVRIAAISSSYGYPKALIFERGSTFDAS